MNGAFIDTQIKDLPCYFKTNTSSCRDEDRFRILKVTPNVIWATKTIKYTKYKKIVLYLNSSETINQSHLSYFTMEQLIQLSRYLSIHHWESETFFIYENENHMIKLCCWFYIHFLHQRALRSRLEKCMDYIRRARRAQSFFTISIVGSKAQRNIITIFCGVDAIVFMTYSTIRTRNQYRLSPEIISR